MKYLFQRVKKKDNLSLQTHTNSGTLGDMVSPVKKRGHHRHQIAVTGIDDIVSPQKSKGNPFKSNVPISSSNSLSTANLPGTVPSKRTSALDSLSPVPSLHPVRARSASMSPQTHGR